jgi:hypothetical protein
MRVLNGWYEKGMHLNKIVTLYSIESNAVGLFSTVRHFLARANDYYHLVSTQNESSRFSKGSDRDFFNLFQMLTDLLLVFL